MPKSTADLPVLTQGVDIIVGANTMDTLQAPPYVGLIPGLPDFTPKTVESYEQRLTSYFGEKVLDIYPRLPAGASASTVAKAFYGVNGDVCNTCPKHWAAQKFLAADNTVFVYEFGYASGFLNNLACHGCEIADMFDLSIKASTVTDKVMMKSYTPELADTMSKYWASFVKTGQPDGKVAWGAYVGGISNATQLHIGTTKNNEPKLSADVGLDHGKCEFFEKFIRVSAANNEKYANFCNNPAPMASGFSGHTIIV